MEDETETKDSWLPEGTTRGDLDDGDFAWLSDAYKKGDEAKSAGRKLPYAVHGKVNEDGWKAAWSRAHSMKDSDFDGGPSRDDVTKTLLDHKPDGVEVEDESGKSADTGETVNPVEPETKQPEPLPVASHKAPDSTERPQLEYKTLAFKATPASDDNGLQENEFEGYAAAFGNLDSWFDIIEKGAFVSGLDDYLANGTVCWQHDWSTPIGKPLAASEDDKGLFLKGRISLTTAGKDALTLLRDDVVTKLSIGYIATASRTLSDEEGAKLFGETDYARILKSLPWYMEGIRVITEIKLFEVSLVTVPANDQAVITAVKRESHAGLTLDEQFTSVLAAVGDYSARVKGLVDLRAKAGRTLSASNRQKLQDMRDSLQDHCDDLDEMIASATPDTDPDEGEGSYDSAGKGDPEEAARKANEARDELRREWLRFQKHEARLHGVDL